MATNNKEILLPSKRIHDHLKNLLLVLAGAIIFAFLMGILANSLVNYFIFGTSAINVQLLLAFILVTLFATIVLAYLLYYYYVFVPYSTIKKWAEIPIIYDIKNAEVIDDPFDGYYPQKLSWQAFSRFKKSILK